MTTLCIDDLPTAERAQIDVELTRRGGAVTYIVHATWSGCLPPSNDQRRAAWACRYYAEGHHRAVTLEKTP